MFWDRRQPRLLTLGVAAALFWSAPASAAEQPTKPIPAFPGAEGFGAYTPGGRGGRIIEVTNLNVEGPGSLQAACEAKGPRIVVFRVSGVIDRGIGITQPYVTIAGQTAPGDGICIRNGGIGVYTHDVVVRYLRARPGDHPFGPGGENRDCIALSGEGDRVHDVIIDHCSGSWGTDENFQLWGSQRNVTIQWCISSESLMDSVHPKGPHGTGMILGVSDFTVSVHHCLLAHHGSRLPFINSKRSKQYSVVDYRNNVMYDHGPWTCSSLNGAVWLNYVGNVIKPGLESRGKVQGIKMSNKKPATRIHVADNIWAAKPERMKDVWNIVAAGADAEVASYRSPHPLPAPPVTTQPAAQTLETVLAHVGCTRPVRDVVDARIVAEVRAGTGCFVDSQEDVGGWPRYASQEPPADSDHDGMPDEWEKRHAFDASDPSDGPKDRDRDGYTNVEEYLNLTDPEKPDTGAPAPHPAVTVQAGNDALRGDAARKAGEERLAKLQQPAWSDDTAEPFVQKVRASGQEVTEYLGIQFVRVPKGEFDVGQRHVKLTTDYELSACEITQAQWVTVMGTRPWAGQIAGRDDSALPAYYVNYADCQELIRRLNACGDRRYRLPTYCEWTHAAKADTDSLWGFGNDRQRVPEHAWCSLKYRNEKGEFVRRYPEAPQAVGQLKPNPYGLYDMSGNVREWVHDWAGYWYFTTHYESKGLIDPLGPAGPEHPGWDETRRVCGGHFRYREWYILRFPAARHKPHYRGFVGFRLHRALP